jgi:hypothetical protein
MTELLLPCGFDTLEYSSVKATIGIYTLVDYSVAKKCQQQETWPCDHQEYGTHHEAIYIHTWGSDRSLMEFS